MHLSKLLIPTMILAGACTAQQNGSKRTLDILAEAAVEGKYLYAHQDDLSYGHNWYLEDGRSDVRDVCGDYPAIAGFDLGGIELADSMNLDRVPFDYMREAARSHMSKGGLVTFSWHMRNPLTGGDSWDISSDKAVGSALEGGENHEKFMLWLERAADFLSSVGEGIIFRPYHENLGSWFWWGGKLCSEEEYKALWKMTYDYLEVERGLDLVWVYSPDSNITEEQYMSRYPGDDMVDILGLDVYQVKDDSKDYSSLVKYDLQYMKAIADKKHKLIVLSETGSEGIPDPKWWTEVLAPTLEGCGIGYVLTWRNACDRESHFYGPFEGAACESDFIEFYNNEKTLFLNDIQR